eukprot:6417643-Pyramimonas_sp.AAC.1
MDIVIVIVNVFAIIGAVMVRAVALLNIVVAGATFVIVADVADVILSSRTSEYSRYAHVHHRLTETSIGSEAVIIDGVIIGAAVHRIVSFAKQVAGGRVGCLRERWRWSSAVQGSQLHRIDRTI